MKKLKWAKWLLIIHGLMEISGFLFFIGSRLWASGLGGREYFSFKLSYFQENIELMVFMGLIFGLSKIIAAIGLGKNRMWGFAFALFNCLITLILMPFFLPAGIMDVILSFSASLLLLQGYYGNKTMIE